MPNGHGGFMRFFSPLILALFLAGIVVRRLQHGELWALVAAYVLAAVVAERLAWHWHMWEPSEYGGGYTAEQEVTRAILKYVMTAFVLVLAALVMVNRFL